MDTGNLYGTVVDDRGSALPGVSVTLSGIGEPWVKVTDPQGHFRYLGLYPGSYSFKAELEGFSPVEYPRINIFVDSNPDIEVTMSPANE